MVEMSYKEEHEKFMSGLSGTSVWEILYVMSVIPVCISRTFFAKKIIAVLD